MHIVTIKRLQQAVEGYRDAASDIASWIHIVKQVRWKNFLELKASFPDADDVDGVVVFNLRHNRYRLLVVVHYAKVIEQRLTLGHVYIGAFLTHKEYDRWCGMNRKQREAWLPF